MIPLPSPIDYLIKVLRDRAAMENSRLIQDDATLMKMAANNLEILAQRVAEDQFNLEQYRNSSTLYEDVKFMFKLMFGLFERTAK